MCTPVMAPVQSLRQANQKFEHHQACHPNLPRSQRFCTDRPHAFVIIYTCSHFLQARPETNQLSVLIAVAPAAPVAQGPEAVAAGVLQEHRMHTDHAAPHPGDACTVIAKLVMEQLEGGNLPETKAMQLMKVLDRATGGGEGGDCDEDSDEEDENAPPAKQRRKESHPRVGSAAACRKTFLARHANLTQQMSRCDASREQKLADLVAHIRQWHVDDHATLTAV